MKKVVNNTDEIKHLPYGGILHPGENELSSKIIEDNLGHPGVEDDIESGRIEIPSSDEDEDFPKRTSENSPWYILSNGEKVNGYDNALKAQKELDENG